MNALAQVIPISDTCPTCGLPNNVHLTNQLLGRACPENAADLRAAHAAAEEIRLKLGSKDKDLTRLFAAIIYKHHRAQKEL